jgi:hypothetical protein
MAKRPELRGELAERLALADALSNDPRLLGAFQEAAASDEQWQRAETDPNGFLSSHGVELPEGLEIRFVLNPGQMPVPEYEFFTIRLTRCRIYWVRKPDGRGYEQQEFCRGFEIIPHPMPPIAHPT